MNKLKVLPKVTVNSSTRVRYIDNQDTLYRTLMIGTNVSVIHTVRLQCRMTQDVSTVQKQKTLTD